MKKLLLLTAIIASFILGFVLRGILKNMPQNDNIKQPEQIVPTPKPLEVYTINNLSKTKIEPGILEIGDLLEDNESYQSFIFHFTFNPNPEKSETKTTTGQINIPKNDNSKNYPVIIMIRGYVDQEIYQTGDGTKNAAAYFAKNGFITIAPDFLGYADSDKEAENIFESRFQTYTTALSLIKSLDQIKNWDKKNTLLWAHSNGGHIVLTVLEITRADYPTTLWAPVSKSFPYSILYYTDESEDKGKLIRGELSKFEQLYNTENYSLDNYLDLIDTKLQIHQGTDDDAVPKSWSDNLVNKLKDLDKDVIYYVYPGADHNMRHNWDTVVERDLEFFQDNLK